jgi:hypothetical protein
MSGSEFQWLAVIFGMLTGLGVTRLLTAVAATLRSRATAKVDWIPLIWAGSIFLQLLEYWWITHDLKDLIHEWTYPQFLWMLASPLTLFFSAALILPVHELKSGETHQEVSESHGHWALIFLSVYFLEDFLKSVEYWGDHFLNWWGLMMVGVIVLPVIAFLSRRRVNFAIAVLFLALHVISIFVEFRDLQSA